MRERRRDRARFLRQNLTEVERTMWSVLRGRRLAGFKFRRQVPLGDYSVDFVCSDSRLVIEIDGSQHEKPSAKRYDAERTEWLESQGFDVLRFSNQQVIEDLAAVERAILRVLDGVPEPTPALPLTTGPSPARGEGRMGLDRDG